MEEPFNYPPSDDEPGCMEYGLMFFVGIAVNVGIAIIGSAGLMGGSNQGHWFALILLSGEIIWGAWMMQRRKMGPAVCGFLFSAILALLIYGACYAALTSPH